MITNQWIRKLGLFVFSEKDGIDLSEFHVRFEVCNADVESPNNASIRIYNMSKDTVKRIVENSEYKSVSLNAGYVTGNYGTIFSGTIKQFRIGKENAVDSYLDILAADGDIGYNQGFINQTLAKGYTQKDVVEQASKAMNLKLDYGTIKTDLQHIPNIRGKVMFGMARAFMRGASSVLDSGWSIQNGKIQVVENKGYIESEVVKLNATTGLIGIPEQTGEGIRIMCLLNSRLRIGCLVEIDNSTINILQSQTVLKTKNKDEPLTNDELNALFPYNSYNPLQPLAPLSDDGSYRLFVVEHEGDTRGGAWYSNLIGLAFDKSSKKTLAK